MLVGIQTGIATVEDSMEFCHKTKMELHFYPAITVLILYPKNPETLIQKNLCTPMFIAAQFTIAKCWKQPRWPSVNSVDQKNGATFTQWIPCGKKREGAPTLRESLDRTGEHYAK